MEKVNCQVTYSVEGSPDRDAGNRHRNGRYGYKQGIGMLTSGAPSKWLRERVSMA